MRGLGGASADSAAVLIAPPERPEVMDAGLGSAPMIAEAAVLPGLSCPAFPRIPPARLWPPVAGHNAHHPDDTTGRSTPRFAVWWRRCPARGPGRGRSASCTSPSSRPANDCLHRSASSSRSSRRICWCPWHQQTARSVDGARAGRCCSGRDPACALHVDRPGLADSQPGAGCPSGAGRRRLRRSAASPSRGRSTTRSRSTGHGGLLDPASRGRRRQGLSGLAALDRRPAHHDTLGHDVGRAHVAGRVGAVGIRRP